MTLTITGTVEAIEDVVFLKSIIRGFKDNPKTNDLFWQGYPILIAWEDHVTGLYRLDEEAKKESLREMIDMVNRILSDGLKHPRGRVEE